MAQSSDVGARIGTTPLRPTVLTNGLPIARTLQRNHSAVVGVVGEDEGDDTMNVNCATEVVPRVRSAC